MLLREKDRQALLILFSALKVPVEVWAYGSRINGRAHEGSDLDLVIRSQNLAPLSPEVYAEICANIKDSNIPILVELRDWAMLPESFQQNVERQHEVLFNSRNFLTEPHKKHLLNEPPAEYGK